MAYSLYKLEFTSGLHIGTDTGGASLDDGRMTIHSDTLFSALCCECSGKGCIERLYKCFSEGDIVISDALPYKESEYFLPKPVVYTGNFKNEGRPEVKKSLKSIEYIPLSLFDEYMRGLSGSRIDTEQFKSNFGGLTVNTKVAMGDIPQPYQLAFWNFVQNTGLYIIVKYQSSSDLSFFEDILAALGLSGIGGKQSSGLGKFNVKKETLPSKLEVMLDDSDAEYQMLLGTALPNNNELDNTLLGGWYMTIRRGGFVRSENYSNTQRKKRTMFMLSSGSCLKTRFDGDIFDLSEGGNHPVWRCGKTLFAGVRV